MRNFINNYAIVFVVFFITISCEEVVDIDVPETKPRLVVEATFNRFFRGTIIRSEGIVKLSLSAPFFADEIPPALGAEVCINDPVNNITYNFSDFENDGNYFSNFVPDFDIPYTLTIVYEGETYESTAEMMRTGILEDAVQGDKTLFNEEEKEVIITLNDDPSLRNYYLLDLDVGNFLITDDEFYNGNNFVFSYFYEDLNIGDELTITALGVDERFSSFFEKLQEQSGEDGGGGGPFATPPAIIRGNVVNTTNPRNFPFGYFRISEGNEIGVTITK